MTVSLIDSDVPFCAQATTPALVTAVAEAIVLAVGNNNTAAAAQAFVNVANRESLLNCMPHMPLFVVAKCTKLAVYSTQAALCLSLLSGCARSSACSPQNQVHILDRELLRPCTR